MMFSRSSRQLGFALKSQTATLKKMAKLQKQIRKKELKENGKAEIQKEINRLANESLKHALVN